MDSGKESKVSLSSNPALGTAMGSAWMFANGVVMARSNGNVSFLVIFFM